MINSDLLNNQIGQLLADSVRQTISETPNAEVRESQRYENTTIHVPPGGVCIHCEFIGSTVACDQQSVFVACVFDGCRISNKAVFIRCTQNGVVMA